MNRFSSTVAIDWSGAKGRKHRGIAIAEARGQDAPRLVRPGHIWSREEVLDWLLAVRGTRGFVRVIVLLLLLLVWPFALGGVVALAVADLVRPLRVVKTDTMDRRGPRD